MAQNQRSARSSKYRITVEGRVSIDWSDYLGGLTIKSSQRKQQATTTLSGHLVDQAALVGVINSLYNLGFPILSIEQQALNNKEKTYV